MRRLRRLVQKRSLRWSEGVCVVEGPDLVEAALDSGIEFEAIYVDVASASALGDLIARATSAGVRTFTLQQGVLEKVADAITPQPVLGAVRFPLVDVSSLAPVGLTLVLHDVRDPGNAGTIIRSADAAGASAVIFTGQSVDPFNPKTLRATAGSIFHLPVAVGNMDATLEHFATLGVQTFSTVVRGGLDHRRADFTLPSLVVVGNEAEGLDQVTRDKCQVALSIPMVGHSESLNAGVAASLIAFEALWQRQGAPAPPLPPSLKGT